MKNNMKNNQKMYQMLLVKPYEKEGVKKYAYTNIGVAFRKENSDLIDMKMDLFPILISGAFIQLRPYNPELYKEGSDATQMETGSSKASSKTNSKTKQKARPKKSS